MTIPASSVSTTWSCGTMGCAALPAVVRPDIPRWSSRRPSASSSMRIYFPRRPSAPIRAPSSRSASAGGKGRRRSGRRSSARTIRRPLILNARPRRTVSTSGSSGIAHQSGRAGSAQRGVLDPVGLSSCPMREDETSRGVDFGARRVPEEEKAPLVRAVFDSVAPRYDLMNNLMSGGIHRVWKAQLVAWLKPRPGQVLLDVAGGTGDVALGALPRLVVQQAARGPSIVVCDTSKGMLEIGRSRALDQGILQGIEWVCADAERLPVADRSVDLYTIAFGLRNVTRIDAALAEARRALKPGGRFVCLEFTPEITPLLQPAYDLYSFHIVPWLGRMVTGNWEAYTYLVESIRRFPRQSELCEMIARAGLDQVKFRNLTGGVAALHSAWRL